MAIFLGVAVVVLAGWGSMFIAATFRWTYATWFFFRIMPTAAVVLALLVFVLGIVCRINFGKGLTRYRTLSPLCLFLLRLVNGIIPQ